MTIPTRVRRTAWAAHVAAREAAETKSCHLIRLTSAVGAADTGGVRDESVMPDLIARWNELVLDDVAPGQTLPEPASSAHSVLRPPAAEDEIAAAEDRLGVRLPPSYREFLLVSDGAYADVWGPVLAEWQRPGPTGAFGFLPVRETGWLRDTDPAIAEIWAESSDEPGQPTQTDCAEIWPWTPMARGLRIATDHAPGTMCLVPFDGLEEWQLWIIAKETSEAYRSFRSMLEYQVALRSPITSLAELEIVLSRAAVRDPVALQRLTRTTTVEAVPVLTAVIESAATWPFDIGPWAATGLGRIGTGEALDALVRLNPRGADAALERAGTEYARDLLAARGRYAELTRLGDPRAAAIAAVALAVGESPGLRLTAMEAVGRSADPTYETVLRPFLTSDEPFDQVWAAKALIRLGFADARETLLTLADHPTVGHLARAALD